MSRGQVRFLVSCAHVRPGFEQRRTFTRQRDAFDYAERATKDGYNPESYVFRQKLIDGVWTRA